MFGLLLIEEGRTGQEKTSLDGT